MAAAARAHLESLLRAKKLDVTLTHLRPPLQDGRPMLPTGRGDIDARLGGGLPRGELSEIAGARSTGRTTLMCAALASATRGGDAAALVDTLDRFDVESAAAAGVHLANVLWVRGVAASVEAMRASGGGQGSTTLWRAVERALKAFTVVLESRAFGLAICDLADVPPPVLRRLPFTTWFRLARLIEGGLTAALLVAPERVGRSAGGVTIVLGDTATPQWRGASARARLFEGIAPRARVLGRVWDEGSDEGSDRGSDEGSDGGSDEGSDEGSDGGSDEGSEAASFGRAAQGMPAARAGRAEPHSKSAASQQGAAREEQGMPAASSSRSKSRIEPAMPLQEAAREEQGMPAASSSRSKSRIEPAMPLQEAAREER